MTTPARQSGDIVVVDAVEDCRSAFEHERSSGVVLGLVPTMGNLHEGHAAIIRQAVADCGVVGVTVFTKASPGTAGDTTSVQTPDLGADRALAEACGARYLFAPVIDARALFALDSKESVAPSWTSRALEELGSRWEGETNPRRFAGVATFVTKLASVFGPCRAYFGEKDYQQLVLVRAACRALHLPLEVVAFPTYRDPDGLATSSRNALMSETERQLALVLYRALKAGAAETRRSGATPDLVNELMSETVAELRGVELDYAAVVEPDTLLPASRLVGELRLLIAARVGRVRLLDNLSVAP